MVPECSLHRLTLLRILFGVFVCSLEFLEPPEVTQFRVKFYREKLHLTVESLEAEAVQELCRHYIRGLVWTYRYYYEGCPSWSWYFPYHYSPFVSGTCGRAGGSCYL